MRLACLRSLGYLGNLAVMPVLLPYLQNNNARIRIQTIYALTVFMSASSASKDAVMAKFGELLQDSDTNVRKAVASALASLQCSDAVDAIIDATFVEGGTIARDMGRALKSLDVEQSVTKLLQKLEELQSSSYRRFVVEMLEEVLV